jgi:hypothetical protein
MRLPPQSQPVNRGVEQPGKYPQQNAISPAFLTDLIPIPGLGGLAGGACRAACGLISNPTAKSICQAAC